MMTKRKKIISAFLAGSFLMSGQSAVSKNATPSSKIAVQEAERADFVELAMQALIGDDDQRRAAIDFFVDRGDRDIVPLLVLLMRIGGAHIDVQDALFKLTGQEMKTWRDAMLWQEAHPEIISHPSYYDIKLRYFYNIDRNFGQFFSSKYLKPENMKIRFEEITWGGVKVDGIPSLDNPKMIDASKADYLLDSDLVFGVEINGDVRAYPLRIMGWHEMFNDVIGGVPVALAYCTLCGSGILYETKLVGQEDHLVFGSSGFLYRSNKLMFDRQTSSLWNQFTGMPVVGELVDKDIKLKTRAVTITTWGKWQKRNPKTKVLSLDTGHFRDYDSGVVYNEYFASPELMFPALVEDESIVKRKDYVFGIRDYGAAKAWPLAAFTKKTVINDRIGSKNIVLIGDATTRTVRSYERGDVEFEHGGTLESLKSDAGIWLISEDAITGPNGEKLARISGSISYWFAWENYLGKTSKLYRHD
ncbi:DUF3179 domain-containing protein [Lentilitoribacter sp. Alg239-R112]|uniref:DUF3179 domain-containing protein n=1 Tax=Lentilitoribacter sp. Alg239-R112 TaxID=2305987 RepID=UPI0013A6FE51|nr:DUF3179 domain-containing protein [Lentilitoribacter sp. Alg239-R112]